MEWNGIQMHNKDLKVVLLNSTELLTVPNPFNCDGLGTKAEGYIDMIGIAGNDEGREIDGYETDYLGGGTDGLHALGNSKQRAARRIDFKDTDNNALDIETINYGNSGTNLEKYRPRSLSDGEWE